MTNNNGAGIETFNAARKPSANSEGFGAAEDLAITEYDWVILKMADVTHIPDVNNKKIPTQVGHPHRPDLFSTIVFLSDWQANT